MPGLPLGHTSRTLFQFCQSHSSAADRPLPLGALYLDVTNVSHMSTWVPAVGPQTTCDVKCRIVQAARHASIKMVEWDCRWMGEPIAVCHMLMALPHRCSDKLRPRSNEGDVN